MSYKEIIDKEQGQKIMEEKWVCLNIDFWCVSCLHGLYKHAEVLFKMI